MYGLRPIPWTGLAIAAATAIVLLIADVDPVLTALIALTWAGTLWLGRTVPSRESSDHPRTGFDAERMGELIEAAGTPLLLTQGDRITIANPAARRVLGDHVIGQDVRVALRHPDALALIEAGEGTAFVRGLARRKDIWRMSRKPMSDGVAIIELLNRTAEEDVGRAHTDFVANASHELRTPLASIIGYVETLLEGGPSGDEPLEPATARRFHTTILREARRLQAIVHDLMSLSRIEAGKHAQPERRVALSPLARKAACDAAGVDRSERLDFALDEAASIAGDQSQLEQLVRNLVDNALKYGGTAKPVTVSVARRGTREVELAITDHGDGIEPEHVPHLTRRFYRTDPGRSRASGGTGLGLAIVKHIVERHRGRLDIASEVGRGTIVRVRFPAVAGETPGGPVPGEEQARPCHDPAT